MTTTAIYVGDFDRHVRAMRASNADLRVRIEVVRDDLAQAEAERLRLLEAQRQLGEHLLATEAEIGLARARAAEHLAAIDEAADEEVRRVQAGARAEVARVHRALESVTSASETAAVVPLTRRGAAPAHGPEVPLAGDRIAAV